jgi:hypothetical protein
MKKNLKQKWREAGLDSFVASSGGEYQHQQQLLIEGNAYRLSMMIAMGIGFHNFSEGLTIGQGICIRSNRTSNNFDNWIWCSECYKGFWNSWSFDRSSKKNRRFLGGILLGFLVGTNGQVHPFFA